MWIALHCLNHAARFLKDLICHRIGDLCHQTIIISLRQTPGEHASNRMYRISRDDIARLTGNVAGG